PAYQPPGYVIRQLGADPGEDTLLDSFYSARNYGGADYLQVHDNGSDWQQYPLLRFDIAGLPRGASVRSAQLELRLLSLNAPGTATIHQVTRSWVEGTKSGGGTADGATWFTHDGTNAWSSAGGDINAAVVAETAINGGETWVSWEIAPLVERWLAGEPNYGLLIKPDSTLDQARFASKEDSNDGVQPKLTITYACECGSPCLAPQGKGNVLMVVGDDSILTTGDAIKKALFESWGYTVNLQNDNTSEGGFLSQAASNDVVYVSESVVETTLGTKLTALTIGVVNEEGGENSALGIASGSAWPVGAAINVTDTSHYITAPFPAGPLAIYSAAMEGLTVAGTEAPDLHTLADRGAAGSLVVLDEGAMMAGGGSAAGRRVMLPLGRDSQFNWDYLNGNGRLMVQRALQWGTGNIGGPPKNLLLVVVDPASLTAQEAAKRALIESWGYTVNLIDESDSQANFDAAIAANDVAYIPQDITSSNLGTKLANATIGVVNEEGEQVDELGFSADKLFKSRHEIDVVDNTHYITQPFAIGLLTFVSSDQSVHMLSGSLAPGLQTLAESFNTGSQWKPSLGTLDVGDTLSGGGTAAGRRVELPWGGGTFDINQLTDDGRTIMQRAIEWGAGAGWVAPQTILFVVPDATALGAQDIMKKSLMEAWGFNVALITAADSQANFDAAVASAAVAYISEEATSSDLGTKLRDTTIGVVNEETALTDEFGIAGVRTGYTGTDIEVVDTLHYITSVFASGPLSIASSSTALNRLTGSIAPDLDALAETTGNPELATIETGGLLYDGGTAAGRRVQLPWGADAFDINLLNTDGQTVMRRAIEWGAGATATPQTILLVVTDAAALSVQDNARKALMEGWGYSVSTISANDSQANFDAAVASADAAYVVEQQQSTALGTKLRDAGIAVVNEEAELRQDIGFSANRDWPSTRDTVDIVDNSHYITSPFATGLLTIATAPIEVVSLSGQLAGGLQVLGEQDWGGPQASLSIIDTGGDLYGGGTAAGRRVQLPWGRTGFDINDLNTNGLKLMQRAIEWGIAGGSGGGGGGGPPIGGVVFEEFAEVNPSTTYNVDIPMPGGTVAGDLLIAAIASDEDAMDLTAPAGWNLIVLQAHTTRVTLGVWWKIAGVSEPATHQFTSSRYEMKYGWMMRFSGHDPANPINATSTFATGSSSNPQVASATTTVDNTLVLRVGGFDHEDITVDDPGLAGHTPITMDLGGSGLGAVAGGAGYTYLPTTGATGTTDFALTKKEEYVTGTIAIAPAP
ncbi:MAG: DNRLRE domain-containing protein, partial [Gammaproteobacteria bacterium]|nr:DNRLRE domain-containing protein [Gammaproteobacteria bacterium]